MQTEGLKISGGGKPSNRSVSERKRDDLVLVLIDDVTRPVRSYLLDRDAGGLNELRYAPHA